jgi:hypothetical protein
VARSKVSLGFCWPAGETYRYFRKRVVRALRTISNKHRGENVLIVMHGGVINQILAVCGTSAQPSGRTAGPEMRLLPNCFGTATAVRWSELTIERTFRSRPSGAPDRIRSTYDAAADPRLLLRSSMILGSTLGICRHGKVIPQGARHGIARVSGPW